jgi:membrane-bound metal-dependent hydrolase YbcI (DUF457 family)
MFRTHLAVAVFLTLLFLPAVVYKWSFVIVLLFCSFLPDIDMSQSYLGKHRILRPLQWIVKHRGIFHSITLTLVITIVLMLYYPILALPFFLGYAGHLVSDALTQEGIRPWWPFKNEIKWKVRTGGRTEKMVFYILCTGSFLLLVRLIVSI